MPPDHNMVAPYPGQRLSFMGSSLDPAQDTDERRQALLEQARIAGRRAAEALAVSAGLAERHAQRAEAAGDLERAGYEREVARRARAAVEQIRDHPRPGA
jgi:hypothetical protein